MPSILVVFLAGRFRVVLIIIIIIFFCGLELVSGRVGFRAYFYKIYMNAGKNYLADFMSITNRDFQFVLIIYYHTSSVKL